MCYLKDYDEFISNIEDEIRAHNHLIAVKAVNIESGEELYFDSVYYTDCQDLIYINEDSILLDNIKNIMNLNKIEQAKRYIKEEFGKKIIKLRQLNNLDFIDYYIRNNFTLLI